MTFQGIAADATDLAAKLHPGTLIGALILLGLFLIVGMSLSALLRRAVRLLLQHGEAYHIDRMTVDFIMQLVRVFVWIFVFMLYAHTVPVLQKLGTALLTSVSLASVVIGLAAQSTLANFIAGISLLFYRPFRLGDQVQVTAPTGLETGTVESVTLGHTTLRTWDNRRIVLPNSVIVGETTVNLTTGDPKALALIPFSIGYDSDIDKARKIAIELANAHPGVQEVMNCPVHELGASSVDLILRAWCPDMSTASGVQNDLREAIKKRFDAEGIEIPYDYQNVIVTSQPEKT